MIGSHSVMESPEPVSRVNPPIVTIARMIKAMARSQRPTSLRDACMAVPIQIAAPWVHSCQACPLRRWSGHDAARQKTHWHRPDPGLAGDLCLGGDGPCRAYPASRCLVCEPGVLCRFGSALDCAHRSGAALDVC